MLNFSVPPRITPFAFDDGPINAGEYTSLTCMAPSGDLPLNITWLFNGKSVNGYQEISTTKAGRRGSNLMIESASYYLSGNYTCVAMNNAGTYHYSAELLVNGYLISYLLLFENLTNNLLPYYVILAILLCL